MLNKLEIVKDSKNIEKDFKISIVNSETSKMVWAKFCIHDKKFNECTVCDQNQNQKSSNYYLKSIQEESCDVFDLCMFVEISNRCDSINFKYKDKYASQKFSFKHLDLGNKS
jgi:hypothetical protein